MKDIEQAILAEKKYIEKKISGKEANIFNYIGMYGYDSLEKFNEDKQEYFARNDGYSFFEVPSDFSVIADLMLSNKYKYLLWNIKCDGEIAFVPNGFEGQDRLKEYGIRSYTMWYDSEQPDKSVIITGNGDLKVGLFYEREEVCDFIIRKILNFVRKFYDNTVLDGNDILIDGRKVIAFAHSVRENKKAFYFNASFTDRGKIITEICGDSVKVPYYIDRFSASDLLNELKVWLQ